MMNYLNLKIAVLLWMTIMCIQYSYSSDLNISKEKLSPSSEWYKCNKDSDCSNQYECSEGIITKKFENHAKLNQQYKIEFGRCSSIIQADEKRFTCFNNKCKSYYKYKNPHWYSCSKDTDCIVEKNNCAWKDFESVNKKHSVEYQRDAKKYDTLECRANKPQGIMQPLAEWFHPYCSEGLCSYKLIGNSKWFQCKNSKDCTAISLQCSFLAVNINNAVQARSFFRGMAKNMCDSRKINSDVVCSNNRCEMVEQDQGLDLPLDVSPHELY